MAKTKQRDMKCYVDDEDNEHIENFILTSVLPLGVECRCGHKTRLFNIGRSHIVACDRCRTWMWGGANIFSDWRYENDEIWDKNRESIKGYRKVE